MAWAMGSGNMEEAKTPQRWAIYLSPDYLPAFLARMTTEYPWTSQDKDSGHWQLSSSPPARLDFTGFQWKPALSFDRNQAKEQHSCSGRGRNPSTVCIYTSFLCLFFTLTAEEEEPGVPQTPHDPHWGNHPEQTCSKASLPHVMEKTLLNIRLLQEAAVYQPWGNNHRLAGKIQIPHLEEKGPGKTKGFIHRSETHSHGQSAEFLTQGILLCLQTLNHITSSVEPIVEILL